MIKLWTQHLTPAQLPHSCAALARELQRGDPFCLWLKGEVGAGKTSWVSAFLHHLGLDHSMAVASPTFTYARAYRIGEHVYNHCDLYRVNDISGWQALGIEAHNYRGLLIEWASESNCDLRPTHRLHIEFCNDPMMRRYVFYR